MLTDYRVHINEIPALDSLKGHNNRICRAIGGIFRYNYLLKFILTDTGIERKKGEKTQSDYLRSHFTGYTSFVIANHKGFVP